jgi:RNA polymerase sigma factor (sigma-70 family)
VELAAAEAQSAMAATLRCLTAEPVLRALAVQAQWVVGRQEAEDIVQEFFLRRVEQVVLRWRREQGDLMRFLLSSLRNFAIDSLRRARSGRRGGGRQPLPLQGGDGPVPGIEPVAGLQASPEDLAMNGEMTERLWRAAAELKDDLWTPFRLHHGDGLELQAIASALRLSETTVKGRVARARERVTKRMAEGSQDPSRGPSAGPGEGGGDAGGDRSGREDGSP